MRTYLIAAPAEAREAGRFGCSVVHAAYRIGDRSTLLRQSLPLQAGGGLLWISDRNAPEVSRPEELCAAVERECARRGCEGVTADFTEPPRSDLAAFLGQLGGRLSRRRLALYLPESYAAEAPEAFVLIGTALSGGTYRERLDEAAQTHGGYSRLALDAERLRMDFPLPCPTGMGTPLSAEEFHALREREEPAVFFSPDLCARYFTYQREGQHHFVLFDDAGTMREKLRIGAEFGIGAAFFSWPEVADLAEELFSAPLP